MPRFRIFTAALGIASALAACSAAPNPPDYGVYPENYQEIVTNWLHAHRPNVDSMRGLTMTKPVQDRVWVGNMYGGFAYGYKTCVTYDIKNAYGEYTGPKDFTFLLKNGELAHAGVYDVVNDGC